MTYHIHNHKVIGKYIVLMFFFFLQNFIHFIRTFDTMKNKGCKTKTSIVLMASFYTIYYNDCSSYDGVLTTKQTSILNIIKTKQKKRGG